MFEKWSKLQQILFALVISGILASILTYYHTYYLGWPPYIGIVDFLGFAFIIYIAMNLSETKK